MQLAVQAARMQLAHACSAAVQRLPRSTRGVVIVCWLRIADCWLLIARSTRGVEAAHAQQQLVMDHVVAERARVVCPAHVVCQRERVDEAHVRQVAMGMRLEHRPQHLIELLPAAVSARTFRAVRLG